MSYIISYQKVADEHTVHEISIPDLDGEMQHLELCTVNGITYVSINDATVVSDDQIEGIVVNRDALSDDIKLKIKEIAPAARLIKKRKEAMIQDKYSVSDQLALTSIAAGISLGKIPEPSARQLAALDAFEVVARSASQWAAQQYSELGL